MEGRPALTDEALSEAERLVEAATPGPWEWGDWYNCASDDRLTSETKQTIDAPRPNGMISSRQRIVSFENDDNVEANAALIVHAVNLLPALVAEVRALRAERDAPKAKAPDADGWIEWNGGECPVPADTLIWVKLERGYLHGPPTRADGHSWQRNSGGLWGDILAYRTQPKTGGAA